MRTGYIQATAAFCIALSLFACKGSMSQKAPIETVDINFDNIEQIDINQGEVIEIETNDSSLLYSIDRMILIEDKIFIQSRKIVLAFDRTGRYLFRVGDVGRGPNEYLSVNSFLLSTNCLSIYDWQSRRVLDYDFEGNYLSSRTISESSGNLLPSNIFMLPSGEYLSRNTYRGEHALTPEFSLLNNNLEYIRDFTGFDMIDGINRPDILLGDHNTLVYSRYFSDTLYRVSISTPDIKSAYYVNFGAHKLSERAKEGKDFEDLIQESNTPEYIDNIATMIRHCSESQNKLRFIFAFRTDIHYVEYDKNTGISKTFRFTDPKHKLKPDMFISYTDEAVYISASKIDDIIANPVLIKLNNEIFQ